MIEAISIERLRIPLREPYKLAFGPVTHFDTVLVEVTGFGGQGIGEATYLPGYSDETVEEAWPCLVEAAEAAVGMPSIHAVKEAGTRAGLGAFSRTALVTACEMAAGSSLLKVPPGARVRLLAGLNATEPDAIATELERHLAAGFATIKVKAGFQLEEDLERVRLIQRHNRGRARLRIDGNQGFSLDDGCRFAAALVPDGIELLEQPCAAEDWDAAAAVARVTRVPLMLDESIFALSDIDRAARIGAKFVKLKLMKMGSLAELDEGLKRIRTLGMTPVLGNGVASDIGCWMELAIAVRTIANAGEMNGFLRQSHPLAEPPMELRSGEVSVGPCPRLSKALRREARVAAFEATMRRARGAATR